VLLVFIDDATGKLVQLRFVDSESFFSYAGAAEEYFRRCGKPVAFYSDKHGIFRVNLPSAGSGDALTQFGRAMQELDIQIICANTPQAKGRVERVNQTLQDRLVKEMRLRSISSLADGNAYLAEFIEDFNRRFAIEPRSSVNAHRPLTAKDDLARILTWQESRTLSKNLTLQFEKVVYQIQTQRPTYAMRQAVVTVCKDARRNLTLLYQASLCPTLSFISKPSSLKSCPPKMSTRSSRPRLASQLLIILGARALPRRSPNVEVSPRQKGTFLFWKTGDILSLG
jgi:hypothetical protein